jgi:uncharacterized protein
VSLFLLTFSLIYAGLHVYAFLKAKAAIAFGPVWGICLVLFMALMIAAPFLTRFLEKSGHEAAARVSAYIGYSWLGLLFLFSSYAFLLDLYRLVLYFAGFAFAKNLSAFSARPGLRFFLPLVLSAVTCVYGYFDARDIRTEHVTIKTAKMPAGMGRLRIAQISDVHLGLIVREDRLKNILTKVKETQPDILVSTGDLVDGDVCKLNGLSNLLAEIKPRFGKYAITGNHEFYAGFEQAKCFIEDAGFVLLRGEAAPAGPVTVAGVDDPAARAYGLQKSVSEKELLSGLARDRFTLFLKHRPLVDPKAAPHFDLQLSGHVHGGQIFPFTLATWLYYPVASGYAKVSNGAGLYVSRGSGTWGPPIRFLAPPEVAVIDLVREDGE